MIEAIGLTKTYGDKRAVDDLSFLVRPGIVTGFLGPNGAGKSTTMRMVVGLDAPSSGSVTVGGRRYAQHVAPLHEVGTLLEARAVHTSRSAYNHLRALAATHGIGRSRVDQVIELVGLREVARNRAGGFSLGMGQRLGIASALLGDPAVIMLDEPVNGLDPEGVRWVRDLLRSLAAEGRTVFVSSHLMSEVALTAEHLIVVGRGKLLADVSVEGFIAANSSASVRLRSPGARQLRTVLAQPDVTITGDADVLEVHGLTCAQIGDAAAHAGIALHELTALQASLEEAFMAMTADSVEYHATPTTALSDRQDAA